MLTSPQKKIVFSALLPYLLYVLNPVGSVLYLNNLVSIPSGGVMETNIERRRQIDPLEEIGLRLL